VTVSANATDNVGVARVQFQLDGVNLGLALTAAPYTVTWNTTNAANGSHTLTAIAADAAGNQTTATPITVTVNNPAPTPGPGVLPTATVGATAAQASRVGPVSGAFTLARTGDTSTPLTVAYSLSGTAANGVDYQSIPASLTIPAGASSALLVIAPLSSTNLVGSESVILTLAANSLYTVGTSNSATVNIAGNNVPTTSVKTTGASVTITWASTPGKIYRVAYKSSMTDTTWTNLSGNITATSASTSWTDQSATKFIQRFYVVYVEN
jgi:hypothetical protein